MDIKSFSDESFDPVVWIDKSFDELTPDASRESHASAVVYRLQLFIQEINKSLEETAHSVIRTLPLVLRQAEQLEDQVQCLAPIVKKLESEAKGLQDNESLERVRSMHEVVEKMKSSLVIAKSLREQQTVSQHHQELLPPDPLQNHQSGSASDAVEDS